VPHVLVRLPAIAGIRLLLKIIFFIFAIFIVAILLIFFLLSFFLLGFFGRLGFLLLLRQILQLYPLRLLVIDLLDGSPAARLLRLLLGLLLGLLLCLLLPYELLALGVFSEQGDVLFHYVLDFAHRGRLIAEKVCLASHEREQGIEEVVDSAGVLDGTHEEAIEPFVVFDL
jgi:hypothetical protein